MTPLRLSLVQMDSVHLQPKVNVDRMEAWAERENQQGADLVVFPELATTGYLEPIMPGHAYSKGVGGFDKWEDFLERFSGLAEPVPGPTTERLMAVARRLDLAIVFGMLEALPGLRGAVANTVVAVNAEGIAGIQRKLHLPWNERHVFTSGNELRAFELVGVKVGINVCYDAYFPEQTRALALQGAELVLSCFTGPCSNSADSGIPVDRASMLSRVRAMENGIYFAAVNRVGEQGDYHFIGNSAIADPAGCLIASTDSKVAVAIRAEIDLKRIERTRYGMPLLKDRRSDLYRDLTTNWEALAINN